MSTLIDKAAAAWSRVEDDIKSAKECTDPKTAENWRRTANERYERYLDQNVDWAASECRIRWVPVGDMTPSLWIQRDALDSRKAKGKASH